MSGKRSSLSNLAVLTIWLQILSPALSRSLSDYVAALSRDLTLFPHAYNMRMVISAQRTLIRCRPHAHVTKSSKDTRNPPSKTLTSQGGLKVFPVADPQDLVDWMFERFGFFSEFFTPDWELAIDPVSMKFLFLRSVAGPRLLKSKPAITRLLLVFCILPFISCTPCFGLIFFL